MKLTVSDDFTDASSVIVLANSSFSGSYAVSCTTTYYFAAENLSPLSAANISVKVTEDSAFIPFGAVFSYVMVAKQEMWYFSNTVDCNNVTVTVTSDTGLASLSVSQGSKLSLIT